MGVPSGLMASGGRRCWWVLLGEENDSEEDQDGAGAAVAEYGCDESDGDQGATEHGVHRLLPYWSMASMASTRTSTRRVVPRTESILVRAIFRGKPFSR